MATGKHSRLDWSALVALVSALAIGSAPVAALVTAGERIDAAVQQ